MHLKHPFHCIFRYAIRCCPVILLFLSFNSFAQKHITFTVYQVSTTIGDCDGFLTGDSDPAWWWTGPDPLDDECYERTCNGCTTAVSINIMDEYYDCAIDVPGSISVTFQGCEDDGPTGCVFGSALSIVCDGNYSNRTDVLPTSISNGTFVFPPYWADATGCNGRYTYW